MKIEKNSGHAMAGRKKPMAWKTVSRIFETPASKVGLILFLAIFLMCVFAPFVTSYSPTEMDLAATFATPNKQHILGCDNLGRDVLARLLYGGRNSIMLGVFGALVGAVGGVVVGVVAGYFGGQVDNLLMRFCDVWTAIPSQLLCILISSVLGTGFFNTVLALGISGIPNGGRMTRGQILAERSKEYLEAAESINTPKLVIMFKHLMPNVISPTIVGTTMSIGSTIMQAAGLSYIGLGVQEPTPEWGAMLSASRGFMQKYPHLVLFPGLFIGLFVFSINLMGDGLRDALDPKLRK